MGAREGTVCKWRERFESKRGNGLRGMGGNQWGLGDGAYVSQVQILAYGLSDSVPKEKENVRELLIFPKVQCFIDMFA